MITEPGLYNMDCMIALKEYPDNYFDLAIVDPPYGDAGGGSVERRDSENGSTDTAGRLPRQKLRGGTTHYERPQKRTESTGLVEHGRRSSEKNHSVGRGPGQIIF